MRGIAEPVELTGWDLDELHEPLSPREAEILSLIAMGFDNADIAARLFVSMNTVKSHVRGAYRKIGVRSRSHAIIWSFRNGLVQVPLAGAADHSGR